MLAALYLPGAPYPNLAGARARWPRVLDIARRADTDWVGCTGALRTAGLWDEASVLEANAEWALEVCGDGRVTTVACPDYPSPWRMGLGRAAPPALWRSGQVPSQRWITVVGSRRPSELVRDFVARVGTAAVAMGYGVASGGAPGVDQTATLAGLAADGPGLEVLPCGLCRTGGFGVAGTVKLSVSSPSAGFTVSAAMERNSLLYALGSVAVVVQPRLGEGGTWTGALAALRRRIGKVAVWSPPAGTLDPDGHSAVEALVRLGATRLSDPGDWQVTLARCTQTARAPCQASLFGDFIREAG